MITMPANVSHYGGSAALQLDTIADALLSGCATVDRHGRAYGGSGILVALDRSHGWTMAPTRHRAIVRDVIRRWVADVAHVVTARPAGLYFGAWRDDDGTLYLDVAQLFSDADEAEALAAARARGELAVWHAGRRQCILITPETTREAA